MTEQTTTQSQAARPDDTTMRAVVQDRYGEPGTVMALRTVPRPTAGDGEVLVRVRAASINPYDWHLVTGLPYPFRVQFGLSGPKARVAGADLAGAVVAVGPHVTRVGVGDDVFGLADAGSLAEYVTVPEADVVRKPTTITFEQAAAVPMGGLTALQGLRDVGRVRPGRRVLINGASGGVGTFAVQLAALFGAEVTGVCSGRNVELVRSLGARHVIDYTQHDFTQSDRRYDLLFDLVGNHRPSACRRVLARDGVYVASFGQPEHRWLGPLADLGRMFVQAPFVRQRMTTFVAQLTTEDLQFLKELLQAGKLTPVIDRTRSLAEAPEAMRYLAEGHARGKVVITVPA